MFHETMRTAQELVTSVATMSLEALCLKCGLCCDGTLFTHVALSVEEAHAAQGARRAAVGTNRPACAAPALLEALERVQVHRLCGPAEKAVASSSVCSARRTLMAGEVGLRRSERHRRRGAGDARHPSTRWCPASGPPSAARGSTKTEAPTRSAPSPCAKPAARSRRSCGGTKRSDRAQSELKERASARSGNGAARQKVEDVHRAALDGRHVPGAGRVRPTSLLGAWPSKRRRA